MLGAWLCRAGLVPALALGACVQGSGRVAVAAGYAALLARGDADGDGRLDRSEVTALVAAAVPGDAPAREALRFWLVARWMSADADGDGKLSLDELARAPLAAFDCADANQDGNVSAGEIGAVLRCAGQVVPDGGPGNGGGR